MTSQLRLITRIETTCNRLGKDDKLQLFICLAVHDKLLQRIVADLTKAVAAIQLYDVNHSRKAGDAYKLHQLGLEDWRINEQSVAVQAAQNVGYL